MILSITFLMISPMEIIKVTELMTFKKDCVNLHSENCGILLEHLWVRGYTNLTSFTVASNIWMFLLHNINSEPRNQLIENKSPPSVHTYAMNGNI